MTATVVIDLYVSSAVLGDERNFINRQKRNKLPGRVE